MVGLDGHHLTFFEMLGNFSFGQYFKEGAIEFAPRVHARAHEARLGPDLGRRVHAGDPELGLGPDEVAIDLWREDRHAARADRPAPDAPRTSGRSAAPGRAGPTRRSTATGARSTAAASPTALPGCTRCDRFLEFWNLVFMEYELHADGTLTPLPKQNIDTGMGLERAAAILQDVAVRLRHRRLPADHGLDRGRVRRRVRRLAEATKAHRILADHGRGMTFLVGDGVTPSNEGRGYVLRRIVRRASSRRSGSGSHDVHRAARGVVVEQMGDAYPELGEHAGEIERVLRAEEERFPETLERGLKLFEELAPQATRSRARTRSRSRRRTASRWS